jgi:hypothetical protein
MLWVGPSSNCHSAATTMLLFNIPPTRSSQLHHSGVFAVMIGVLRAKNFHQFGHHGIFADDLFGELFAVDIVGLFGVSCQQDVAVVLWLWGGWFLCVRV